MSQRSGKRPPSLSLIGAAPPSEAKAGPADGDLERSILMARAQAGDQEAYRRLLEGILPYLRRRAARSVHEPAEIEDMVQDILLTLHAIRHTYDPTRPFGPWLATIADRRIVDRLRRRGRRLARERTLDGDAETFRAAEANNPVEAEQDKAVARGALHRAVGDLPPAQRRAVTLLKLEGRSLKEASDLSGMSVAALKVAMHRALLGLRRRLRGDEEGER